MKIAVMSDLHMECYYKNKWDPHVERFFAHLNPNDVEVLVLAGDIVALGEIYKDGSKNIDTYYDFLWFYQRLCNMYPLVLMVPGNHEYYYSSFSEVDKILGEFEAEIPNFKVLNNKFHEHNGQRFVGSTLWFEDNYDNHWYYNNIADFSLIKNITNEVYQLCNKSIITLGNLINKDSMVFTHHIPTKRSISPMWKNSSLNRFFLCDVEDRLITTLKPKMWVHGHTHNPFNYHIGKTLVYCNPAGYKFLDGHNSEGQNPRFFYRILRDI